jgi:transaldolase
MQIYADTSNVDEIQRLWDGGLIQGVTTNPSIIAKEYGTTNNWHNVIKDICRIVNGPVSAEVISTEVGEMVQEGRELSELHDNVVVKLPCTPDGVHACKVITQFMDIKVNMTLCFSVAQAVLASNVGAAFISPFVGRMDDYNGKDYGVALVKEIQEAYINDLLGSRVPRILAASIRSVEHLNQVAQYADIATCPPKIIWETFRHKLTVSGLKQFRDDWNKVNE